MTLCELEFADVEEMSRLLACAFARESNWAPRLRRALSLGPGNWIGARDPGAASAAALPEALIGMGGITVMGAAAYVGFVAVHPSRRGKGVARAIMERLLELAADRGCATLLLDASEAGRPLYEKLGFAAEGEVGLWRRDAPAAAGRGPAPVPPDLSISALAQAGTISPGGLETALREVARFDEERWGADRSALLASFAADGTADIALARGDDGAIAGYAILQRGDGVLGPWLADSPDAAGGLLGWALAADRPPAAIYLPATNLEGARLAREAGFRLERSQTHMRRGPALAARRRRAIYGQASFAFG